MKQTIPLSFNHELTFTSTASKTRRRWLFRAMLLLLISGVVTYTVAQQGLRRPPQPLAIATPPVAPAIARPVAATEPSGSKVNVVVRRNDTIEGIFKHLKLSAADLNTVLNMPGVGASFKQLKPGDKMTVVHDGSELHAINRHISETEVLSVTRSKNGFAAERIITMN